MSSTTGCRHCEGLCAGAVSRCHHCGTWVRKERPIVFVSSTARPHGGHLDPELRFGKLPVRDFTGSGQGDQRDFTRLAPLFNPCLTPV